MWILPIGYKSTGGRTSPSLVPDPETAPLIRLAFERMATGRVTQREALEESQVEDSKRGTQSHSACRHLARFSESPPTSEQSCLGDGDLRVRGISSH